MVRTPVLNILLDYSAHDNDKISSRVLTSHRAHAMISGLTIEVAFCFPIRRDKEWRQRVAFKLAGKQCFVGSYLNRRRLGSGTGPVSELKPSR